MWAGYDPARRFANRVAVWFSTDYNFIASSWGKFGENPALTRNRYSRNAHVEVAKYTRRGLRGVVGTHLPSRASVKLFLREVPREITNSFSHHCFLHNKYLTSSLIYGLEILGILPSSTWSKDLVDGDDRPYNKRSRWFSRRVGLYF